MLFQALQALLPEGKGARLLPVLNEDLEGEASLEGAIQDMHGAVQRNAGATEPGQDGSSVQGLPLRRSLGAVAVRLPATQFEEGEHQNAHGALYAC